MSRSIDFVPNADVAFDAGEFGGAVPTDTAGNRYTNVDEVTLDEADYTFAKGGTFTHNVRFAVTNDDLAGKRILSVEMLVDAKIAVGSGPTSFIQLNLDGAGGGVQQTVTGSTVRYSEVFATNNLTAAAWTIPEVVAFATSRELDVDAQAISTAEVRMFRYTMRVHFEEEGWGAVPLGF